MEKEQQYKVIISPHAFKMLDRQVRFVAEISAVSANKLRKPSYQRNPYTAKNARTVSCYR